MLENKESKAEFVEDAVFQAKKLRKGSRSAWSNTILALYKFPKFRKTCLSICNRLEGDRFFSATLRDILDRYHGVSVGKYSYGPCLTPKAIPRGTKVGAYSSLGSDLHIFRRNHPEDTLSQHPFFYNSKLGFVVKDTIKKDEENPLVIGNDVWIGCRVTILPGCRNIGDGAMIGAGSVITKDIPPYSIVAGVPAKIMRKRYLPEVEELIVNSKWWELDLEDLLRADELLMKTISISALNSFLNSISDT